MLFGRRKRIVKRILIVEDEPLVAFDNENMLGDHGYELVATVDDYDRAIEIINSEEEVHLILSDVRLSSEQTGLDLARHAKSKGVPTLFATGQPHDGAHEVAVGCLMKPYSERQLIKAIDCVDRHLQNQRYKAPRGLQIFIVQASSEE